jgi:uncharacterized membrane protein
MFRSKSVLVRIPLVRKSQTLFYTKVNLRRPYATVAEPPKENSSERTHTEATESVNNVNEVAEEKPVSGVDEKTAEQLKIEAEKARLKLEELKSIEVLFRKFLIRALRYVAAFHKLIVRSTLVAVIAVCALFFALKKKNKDQTMQQYTKGTETAAHL